MSQHLTSAVSQIAGLPFPTGRLGMGTWQIGGPTVWGGRQTGWGETNVEEALSTLAFALEQGINFFDTADAYGRGQSEKLLGQAIRRAGRSEIAICTKFGTREDLSGRLTTDFSPEWLEVAVEGSLRRLQREVIDILLLHSPPDDFDWSRYDAEPFERLIRAGKIRAYGVSAKSVAGAEHVVRSGFGQVVEAIYNVLDRRAEEQVLPLCAEKGYAFIARCPLASGFLVDAPPARFADDDIRSSFPAEQNTWMQASVATLRELFREEPFTVSENALRFAASHPQVSVAIPGMRKRKHVESVIRCREHLPLNPALVENIRQALPETYPGWIRRS